MAPRNDIEDDNRGNHAHAAGAPRLGHRIREIRQQLDNRHHVLTRYRVTHAVPRSTNRAGARKVRTPPDPGPVRASEQDALGSTPPGLFHGRKRHREAALENFDLNMAFFAQIPAESFEDALTELLSKNKSRPLVREGDCEATQATPLGAEPFLVLRLAALIFASGGRPGYSGLSGQRIIRRWFQVWGHGFRSVGGTIQTEDGLRFALINSFCPGRKRDIARPAHSGVPEPHLLHKDDLWNRGTDPVCL